MGDFAEFICRRHFEYMGYSVDNIGVETMAPKFFETYLNLYKEQPNKQKSINEDKIKEDIMYQKLITKSPYIRSFTNNYMSTVDFLISRQINSNTIDGALVEVKYRTNFDPEKLISELKSKYGNFLSEDKNQGIIFYVLCKNIEIIKQTNVTRIANYEKYSEKFSKEGFKIFLLYINKKIFSDKELVWYAANDNTLDRFSPYKKVEANYQSLSFRDAYEKIKPYLNELSFFNEVKNNVDKI